MYLTILFVFVSAFSLLAYGNGSNGGEAREMGRDQNIQGHAGGVRKLGVYCEDSEELLKT